MSQAEQARGDAELRRQPGVWAGKRRRPSNQTEALEQWSPVAIAWCIDRGFVQHTPLQLTPAGWRWLKSKNRQPIDAPAVQQ